MTPFFLALLLPSVVLRGRLNAGLPLWPLLVASFVLGGLINSSQESSFLLITGQSHSPCEVQVWPSHCHRHPNCGLGPALSETKWRLETGMQGVTECGGGEKAGSGCRLRGTAEKFGNGPRAGGTERKCPYLILEVACGHWLGLEVRPRGQPAGSPGPSSQAASILGTLPKCSQVSLMESESRGWETRER